MYVRASQIIECDCEIKRFKEGKEIMERNEGMDLEALRFKLRYLNCIDDTIQKPDEIWLHPDTNTVHYIKRYEGNITIIVKAVDHGFDDYEVIDGDHEYVDSLRRGIPLNTST